MSERNRSDISVLTPATWLNAAHVRHWLAHVWPGWRWSDIREQWDQEGRWYWIIPDFKKGRSRVLGVASGLLEEVTVGQLRKVLEGANWLERVEVEALIVGWNTEGKLIVSRWEPALDEAWFPDPHGGFFVAFPATSDAISAGGPARLPEEFLALHGETWSALGPYRPRSAHSYALSELEDRIPKS